MVPYVYEVRARFSDTDLYGVVHHSNYFRWIEEARIELLEEIVGLSVDWLEAENIRFPVINVEGKYRRPVYAREVVYVNTYLYYSRLAKLTFKYEVVDADNKVYFTALTDHAVIRDNKMLLKVPDEFDAHIRKKISEYGEGYYISC